MALTDNTGTTGMIRECWIRSSTSVALEIAARAEGTSGTESLIVNESYIRSGSEEEAQFIVRQECFSCISGKLCVKNDGSVYVINPKDSPNDVSFGFIQHVLEIPSLGTSREQPQPKYILLESQMENLRHYFVCWNLSSGPTVMCKQLHKYNSNGELQINIKDNMDQKFVWMIPVEDSNQFSMKPYDHSYYFAFASDGRATLHRGGASSPELQRNSIFRFENCNNPQ